MTDFDPFAGNFEFADFGLSNTFVDPSMQTLPPTQPNPYALPTTFASPADSAVSPVTPGFEHSTGKKRKLDNVDPNSQQAIDEAARVAAEEDKRRRNTAASARFRVKKKQREQALEKTAKDMSDRVNILESRIQQLETENTWLKGLITEKNSGKSAGTDFTAMLKKHVEETQGDRISGSRTDGVGTKKAETKA
jgi:acyl-CoA reductase-like NAD-dependent aldehyde dehydrogenase